MLTLHTNPSPASAAVSTVEAGARLDVHTAAQFEATVTRIARDLGTVHIDARATKHVDTEGLQVLTRLVETGGGALVTIEAGPAVQVAALLQRNETLATAVLALPQVVAA